MKAKKKKPRRHNGDPKHNGDAATLPQWNPWCAVDRYELQVQLFTGSVKNLMVDEISVFFYIEKNHQ